MRKRSKGIMLHKETMHRVGRSSLQGAAGGTDTDDTFVRSACQGSCMNTCYPSQCPTFCGC